MAGRAPRALERGHRTLAEGRPARAELGPRTQPCDGAGGGAHAEQHAEALAVAAVGRLAVAVAPGARRRPAIAADRRDAALCRRVRRTHPRRAPRTRAHARARRRRLALREREPGATR